MNHHFTHTNASRHIYECVMSHIWMSRVTRANESRHKYVFMERQQFADPISYEGSFEKIGRSLLPKRHGNDHSRTDTATRTATHCNTLQHTLQHTATQWAHTATHCQHMVTHTVTYTATHTATHTATRTATHFVIHRKTLQRILIPSAPKCACLSRCRKSHTCEWKKEKKNTATHTDHSRTQMRMSQ